MKKILFIFIILISSCGYQPIYININEENLIFKKIILNGEKEINKRIINSLKFKEDTTVKSNKLLSMNSNYQITETSKNSKGQVTSYRSKIEINLIIKLDDEIIKNKNFTQDFNYNNLENKFNLTEYQNEIKDNLINKMIEEIIVYINL